MKRSATPPPLAFDMPLPDFAVLADGLKPDFAFDAPKASLPAAPGEWQRANEARQRIAATIGVPIATWTTRTRSAKRETIDARRLANAIDAVQRLPTPDETVHIVTGQEFAGFDLLPAMLRLSGAAAYSALILTTLGFSQFNLESLARFIEAGRIPPANLRILCSDFFRRADRDVWRTGAEQARRLGYGFKSSRNHTKLILAELDGKAYVVESSANLRSCANLEQFSLTQSRELSDFHAAWIAQVWPTAEK